MCCVDCPEYTDCVDRSGCCPKCKYYEDGNCTYSLSVEKDSVKK